MARPCGCSGECGCTYIGVDGITVTGTGTTRDPGRIGIANPLTGTGCDAIMSCVSARLGSGLRWNSINKTIQASLSVDGGNTITFGSDGGLYSSGGSGSGDSGYATVDSILARTIKIIGGSYGAGISMWPEGPIDTYQAAMNLRLPIIHVPVRKSADFYLWAIHNRDMGMYHWRFGGNRPDSMDQVMGQRMFFTPGGDPIPTAGWPAPYYEYGNKEGYFGFGSPPRQGMVRVSDVFQAVQRRSVLYLEVKDIGGSNNDEESPQSTFSLLTEQILQFGAQKSVVVGVNVPTTTSTADRLQITNGLALVNSQGIVTAWHFNGEAEMDMFPPATLQSFGVTWAFFPYHVADWEANPTAAAKVKAYRDAGIRCMLHSVTRQYQFNMLSHASWGTGGLTGAICFDPVYAAGQQHNYGYRELLGTWGWGTPDHGRHAPDITGIPGKPYESQRDLYRGYVIGGVAGYLCLDGTVRSSPEGPNGAGIRETGYFILAGEQCPIFEPSYDIEVDFWWDSLISDRGRWMSVFFGVPEDRPIYEWTKTTKFTKGYQFQLSQRGNFIVSRYDGIAFPGGDPNVNPPYQAAMVWESPWYAQGQVNPNSPARIKIRVRPDRIVLGPASQAENGANTRTFSATQNPTIDGLRWRGPYMYLGRHFFFDNDSTRVRWGNLAVTIVP